MNRSATLAVFATMAFAVLAGCASTPDECPPSASCANPNMEGYTAPTNPIPEESEADGHDHSAPGQHRFAENASLVAYDDLRRFGWSPEIVVGAHAVDLAGDLLAVGVNAGETDEGQQGFHLFDVSDPAKLTHLSYYEAPLPVSGDRTIAFSQDGKTVFLGYEGDARPGVAAVDVSDPATPTEVAFWDDPQAFGSHTISSGTIGGVQYVFSLAMGVNILRFDGDSFTLVGKYLTADQLAALDAVGQALGDGGTGPAQTYALRALYGHDMTFFSDPVTGKPILFVAYAYEGFKAVDLTVPSSPTLLFRWMPPADTAHKHYTHSVEAARMESGQLLVVVGSETFEPDNQEIASPIWILDATVAAAGLPLATEPTHLSTWRNPGGAAAGNLGLSVHFFRIEDGLLYLSHYHGGIWGIDLRTPEAQAAPAAFGYIMPIPPTAIAPPEECCIGFDLDGAPMVFDLEVKDGVVYGADIIQGVTASRFERPE
ncbi:MAG: LVIVD repeat-containing protein [Thermoplasmatota archaeon]